MNQATILGLTRRQPFQPFRLRLNDGNSYEIYWPDMICPAANEMAVAIPPARADADKSMIDDMMFVSYANVADIEPLPIPSA